MMKMKSFVRYNFSDQLDTEVSSWLKKLEESGGEVIDKLVKVILDKPYTNASIFFFYKE